MGRPLFERRRGATASLTEDGRVAYRHAVALLAEIDSFVEVFSVDRRGAAASSAHHRGAQ